MQELLLGVDVGTTATKAVLVDKSGHIISQGRAEYPTKYLQAGWVEQDPNDWWQSFCDAVAIAQSGAPGAKIIGIAISAQAPTLIAVDGDGVPVRDAMIWMDRRAQLEADELAKSFPNISQASKTTSKKSTVSRRCRPMRKRRQSQQLSSTCKHNRCT